MSRGPWRHKPAQIKKELDLARKVARDGGLDVTGIKFSDNGVEFTIGKPPEEPPAGVAPSPDIIL